MDLIFLLSVVYFYLPGAVANIGANIARFIPFFAKMDAPIDGGFTWKGHRLVGEHKTWGGYWSGIFFGMTFGVLKVIVLDKYWPGNLFLQSDLVSGMFLMFLLSFGALTGDILKSVVKRLLNIPPHSAWIPFDEIDHTLMAMVLVKLFFGVEWSVFFAVIGLYFFLHLATNVIGFWLKIKRVPY